MHLAGQMISFTQTCHFLTESFSVRKLALPAPDARSISASAKKEHILLKDVPLLKLTIRLYDLNLAARDKA